MTHPMHVNDDIGLIPAGPGEGGIGASYVSEIWKNEVGDVRVALWKAEPGRYGATGRAYAETFVMVDGEADVTIDDAPSRRIVAGAIVHVPAGSSILIEVHHAMVKVSTAAHP